MFIPDFWCGVICTVLIELLASVLGIAYIMHKENKENGKYHNDKSNE